MIRIYKVDVHGFDTAVRGMRNPMNSWALSDSGTAASCDAVWEYALGPKDLQLMESLRCAGSDHRKYLRMITVSMDILAPLYWWKEFDTYKVGTVANSCSTMHRIHAKKFTLDDFSHDQLTEEFVYGLKQTIDNLNLARTLYLEKKEKTYWWQMIQLLPSSYNQTRTVLLNYEVLNNIYSARKYHKLDEWQEFCAWIETLPYAKELVVGRDLQSAD